MVRRLVVNLVGRSLDWRDQVAKVAVSTWGPEAVMVLLTATAQLCPGARGRLRHTILGSHA
jgi:hypothetical protein